MQPFSTVPEWVTLEHEVAQILTEQEHHGWYFDERAARELELLSDESFKILLKYFETRFPFVPGAEFTPKRNNKTQGYFQGATFTRLKEFNPSSRDHIAWILKTHDNFTDRDYYDFWENEDRRDDFEEPWYWSLDAVSEDLGDYEESGDDIRRRERMAEAIYET